MVCDGDVCYMPGNPSASATAAPAAPTAPAAYTDKPHPDYFSVQVHELVGKGHTAQEAEQALHAARYDVAAAAAMLEGNEKGRRTHIEGGEGVGDETKAEKIHIPPAYVDGVNTLIAKGLSQTDALELLTMAKGDLPTAFEILDQDSMARDLDAAVEEMVKEGWDEDVARQALLAQREKSKNTPAAAVTVATTTAAAPTPTPPASAAKKPAAPAKKKAGPAKPSVLAVKREDVVFESTEADLQSLVIESPVPVLLDVYADWCGPCKQLGPMLEELAVKSGGMFRLVKVDSDKNRGVSDMLSVQALPSVFAFREGELVDCFVGMPPQATLQDFMMRLLMGSKRPEVDLVKDPNAKTEEDLKRMGGKLAHLAGLASFGAARKEKLERAVGGLVEEVIQLGEEGGDGGEEGRGREGAMRAIKTVSAYLSNLMKHFGGKEGEKFRSINMEKEAFQSRLGPYPPAIRILEKVGFRDEGGRGTLILKHRNRAPIIAAEQVIGKFLARVRIGGGGRPGGWSGGAGGAPIFRSKSLRRPAPVKAANANAGSPKTAADGGKKGSSTISVPDASSAVKPKPAAAAATAPGGMPASKPQMVPRRAFTALSIRLPDGSILKTGLGPTATLDDVFKKVRMDKEKETAKAAVGGLKLVARVPVVRTYLEGGKEGGKKLGDLEIGGGEVILSLVIVSPVMEEGKEGGKEGRKERKVVSADVLAAKAKAKKEKPRRGGAHTLFSEGHLDEVQTKGNRYYGGGSTYYEASVDEEGEDGREKEKEAGGEIAGEGKSERVEKGEKEVNKEVEVVAEEDEDEDEDNDDDDDEDEDEDEDEEDDEKDDEDEEDDDDEDEEEDESDDEEEEEEEEEEDEDEEDQEEDDDDDEDEDEDDDDDDDDEDDDDADDDEEEDDDDDDE
ncbi:thioredoxin [Nannochloropsis oceanica]